jgi:hypothetical protein
MKKSTFFILLIVTFFSCSKKSETENNSPQSLFMSFKTPEWERTIPCDLLVFPVYQWNDSTSLANSSSQSTRQTFYLTYPLDSSKMVRAGNLNRYPIVNYGENNAPFQFSQKLPLDANSLDDLTKRLASLEGFNATSYNEIQSIQYVGSDIQYATFIIKGIYSMQAQQVASSPLVVKQVTGSYSLKVKTTKN